MEMVPIYFLIDQQQQKIIIQREAYLREIKISTN